MRILGLQAKTRFYQASTSELYGKVQETPQTETTPFYPRSPYGVAKLYGYWITVNYREVLRVFRLQRDPLQPRVARSAGKPSSRARSPAPGPHQDRACRRRLYVGNLDARRDWGHARDYVRMMWMMLQQPEPEDYVIATGRQHSVRDLIELAAGKPGLRIGWEGRGVEEQGVDPATGEPIVAIDPRYFRPAEVDTLLGRSRPKRAASSAGSPGSASRNWSRRWWPT